MATNTVATKQTHTAANNASGNTSGPYTISFDYLLESDVEVRVDNTLKTQTTHYTFPSKTSIQFTSGNFPTAGAVIEIKRNTDITVPKVDFQDGSVLTESDLDNNSKHLLFGMQETKEDTESLVSTFVSANAPTGISNGARWYDTVSGRTFVYYVDTDTAQWVEANPPFDAAPVVADGSITNAKVSATAAIAQSKLNISDATTSASGFMSGSDKTKLDGIEASATADQTNAEIRAAVEAATDSNVFTDADHTKLNAIEASATADQTASEIVALVADQTIAPSEIDMEDDEKIKLGTSDDLLIYHNGESLIQHTGAGVFKIEGNGANNTFIRAKTAENSITCVPDGAVQLYHNNVKKAETSADGFDITNGRLFVYNSTAPQVRLNTSSSDGSSTRFAFGIATGSNQFFNGSSSGDACISAPSSATMKFGVGTANQIEFNSTNIIPKVQIIPDADNSFALGSSTKRFTTLHSAALNTGDINMSNLNDSPNEVDGSKGSWSIQEGADDLFVINRVSGKKYKFNLTEIT